MRARRNGMALPAALAAMVMLAGLATLANIAATNAIRESRAIVDAAREEALVNAIRARAAYQLLRQPRAVLLSSATPIGDGDTSFVTQELTWPWHALRLRAGAVTVAAEFARARTPPNPWCNAVVFSGYARIAAGTVSMPAFSTCPDTIRVGTGLVAAFDSAVMADQIGVVNSDTLAIAGTFSGVARATSIELGAGAAGDGVFVASVVRLQPGAVVRGLIVALDSVIIAPGASVEADYGAVFAALSSHARLEPLGRRGAILLP